MKVAGMWNGVWEEPPVSPCKAYRGILWNLRGPLMGRKRIGTWKQCFSSSYSGKMPEVEWFSSDEKTQKSKKVV